MRRKIGPTLAAVAPSVVVFSEQHIFGFPVGH
jgi:hypothetical protein